MFLSACRFQSARAAYGFAPEVTYKLRLADALEAGAEGSPRRYVSAVDASLSFHASADSGKGQSDLAFAMDSLDFRSADRDSGEDRYMIERLRKYRCRLALTRMGMGLSVEEEPSLPPVAFSTLNFGRRLLYGLPAFPGEDIGDGSQWTVEQSLLDKFHPGSKVIKRFTAVSLRKTGEGRLLTTEMEVEIHLEEDLGDVQAEAGAALAGKGKAIFNLDKGLPVSVDLDLQGGFIPASKAGDSTRAAVKSPIKLKEHLRLEFRS